jgi:hypothetical protein
MMKRSLKFKRKRRRMKEIDLNPIELAEIPLEKQLKNKQKESFKLLIKS